MPKSRSSSSQPPNAPGTQAASRPVPGIRSWPSSRKRSIVAAAGATPCPQSTSGSPRSADQKTAGTSPPGPFRCGSTTCSVNPAATAASKALPPALEHRHPCRRREPVGGGHHAEGPAELGSRRKGHATPRWASASRGASPPGPTRWQGTGRSNTSAAGETTRWSATSGECRWPPRALGSPRSAPRMTQVRHLVSGKIVVRQESGFDPPPTGLQRHGGER